ncbi:hypothetical protein [Massilia glaciei]|uniref:Uncharacterized protein n=1 Tax=Massilia glaciei TaxID=1524097 RepID=A0A2U2I4C6_9BURK|nr:hypothetical protein [Massilia glaciei]PWF54650.1 hypothetical protein C7C56_005875 [Massilia glaciei]
MVCNKLRAAAGALLIAATFHAHAADEPLRADAGFKPAEMAATLMRPDNNAATVRGIKRLAITAFDVEFVTKGSAAASATAIGRSGTANVSMTVTLKGVDDPDFQAIVAQLYADFVREVKAAGIELVPTETIMASAAYRKMAAGGKSSPHRKGGTEPATVVAPEGRPIMGLSLAVKGGGLAALANFGAVAGGVFSGVELQKELDATLAQVRMVVRFVDLNKSSSGFLNRISGEAKVSAQVNPAIAAGDTNLNLQSGAGGERFSLQRALLLDGGAIPELKDTSSVAGNVGLAVLSFAIGKGGSSSVVEKEAVADPARYRAVLGGGLGSVGSMMVEQLKTLR